MRLRSVLLSLGVLAMAGCQSMGGVQPSAPGANTPGTRPSGAAAPPSPWAAARARGMAFRAVGSDPDWSVEVSRSHAPTMFVDISDRQRHLQIPNATVSSDQASGTVTFRGSAADGSPVELVVRRGQCQTNMSGHTTAAAVELDVGPHQYKGCGRFLIQ